MKKLAHTLLIFCSFITVSCSSDGSTEIAKIKISDDSSANTEVARDLSTFDYRTMLIKQAGISDEKVLKDITWFTEKNPKTGDAEFKLLLGPNAKPKEEEIRSFFEKVVKEKVTLYAEKIPELDDVEVMADYYISIIETGDLDSVWAQRSANYSRYTSKTDLSNILDQRRQYFKAEGKRKVISRKIAKELGSDLKGEFATVTFRYASGELEDITLEKENGRYKILGYHFILPNVPH